MILLSLRYHHTTYNQQAIALQTLAYTYTTYNLQAITFIYYTAPTQRIVIKQDATYNLEVINFLSTLRPTEPISMCYK